MQFKCSCWSALYHTGPVCVWPKKKSIQRRSWPEDSDPSFPVLLGVADVPLRTRGPDYHLGGLVLSPAGLSTQQAAAQHLFCLSPLKKSSGDQCDNHWEGLSKHRSAWRTGFSLKFICATTWLKLWRGAEVHEVSGRCGVWDVFLLCRVHASGSHLKKCSPFPWINEQLGRTGQGGAICKCHRHCLLILHIIKANIPNLYQSNQEQAITATGAPGEPRPNSDRRERESARERERDRAHSLSIWHTHTSETLYRLTYMLKQTRSAPPTINKHMKSTAAPLL